MLVSIHIGTVLFWYEYRIIRVFVVSTKRITQILLLILCYNLL